MSSDATTSPPENPEAPVNPESPESPENPGNPESLDTPASPPPKSASRIKTALYILFSIVLFILLAIWTTPIVITSIDWETKNFDLSEQLKTLPPGLVKNKTVTIKFDISKTSDGAYLIRADGRILDWAYSADADVRLTWHWTGVEAKGGFAMRIKGSRLAISGGYAVSSSGEWSADVKMDRTRLDDREQVFATLLARTRTPGVENIHFSGDAELNAHAEFTKALPLVKWRAKTRFSGVDFSCTASGKDIRITNLRASLGATGLADHVDYSPVFTHADSLSIDALSLEKVFASIRATETALLVTEAGAAFCGGDIRLYSLFLNPEKLNAGVTIFIDGIETGELLHLIRDFRGDASGRLYGKIPLRLKDGKTLQLSNAYLYAPPGETGKLRISDSESVAEYLSLGGIDRETRNNFASAISNLDYSVLRMTLKPEEDGKMALGIKIEGSATQGDVSVPVSFEITFHGDIEELINTGLGITRNNK